MTGATAWQSAPLTLPTLDDHVHIWRTTLTLPQPQRLALLATLAPNEVARAERFVTAELTDLFVVGRGFLRAVLGRYLRSAPAAIVFHYGKHGKPALAAIDAEAPLQFNLSHSHDLALLAVSASRVLGIDIERERDARDLDDIAVRYFARAEVAAYRALPAPERLRAFYRCWSRKEAYLKANGGGLSFPLGDFTVAFGSQEEPAILASALDTDGGQSWSLLPIDAGPGYAAALVAKGPRPLLRCFEWSPGATPCAIA